MHQIRLSQPLPSSPIVCTLNGIELTLLQAVEMRNQLTVAIDAAQQHLIGKHISNAGEIND